MLSPSEFEFGLDFNFATESPLTPAQSIPIYNPTDFFMLLDNTHFLLLDGTNFSLLGS